MSTDFTQLFYREPYCREFHARVLTCEGPDAQGQYAVRLSESAFYPEGGGQPGDRGSLDEVPVLQSVYQDGQAVQLCAAPLEAGREILGKLDWERRFELMQQHSGEHLISGLARTFYGCTNVGFHISEREMSLDFDRELDESAIERLETEANAAVFRCLPIQESFPDANEREGIDYRSKIPLEGPVRLITVPGVDICACCGTHLKQTGEIGLIKIIHWERYKGGVRLFVLCGTRALRDYRLLQQQAEALSRLYSQESRKLLPELERPLQQLDEQEERLKKRTQTLLALILASRGERGSLCWLRPTEEAGSLKALAKAAAAKLPGFALLLAPSGDSLRYALASETQDMTALQARLKNDLAARGGGRDGFFQGTFRADVPVLERFLEELAAFRFDETNEMEASVL